MASIKVSILTVSMLFNIARGLGFPNNVGGWTNMETLRKVPAMTVSRTLAAFDVATAFI